MARESGNVTNPTAVEAGSAYAVPPSDAEQRTAATAATAAGNAGAPAGGTRSGNMTRNLSKEDEAAIAKKMFIGGLFFLPWLWAVNVFFYRKFLFDKSKRPDVSKWVLRSFIGFCVVTSLFIVWICLFQTQWKNWGSFGTSLLVNIPEAERVPGWVE